MNHIEQILLAAGASLEIVGAIVFWPTRYSFICAVVFTLTFFYMTLLMVRSFKTNKGS